MVVKEIVAAPLYMIGKHFDSDGPFFMIGKHFDSGGPFVHDR